MPNVGDIVQVYDMFGPNDCLVLEVHPVDCEIYIECQCGCDSTEWVHEEDYLIEVIRTASRQQKETHGLSKFLDSVGVHTWQPNGDSQSS